jgi:hypothetical protein
MLVEDVLRDLLPALLADGFAFITVPSGDMLDALPADTCLATVFALFPNLTAIIMMMIIVIMDSSTRHHSFRMGKYAQYIHYIQFCNLLNSKKQKCKEKVHRFNICALCMRIWRGALTH